MTAYWHGLDGILATTSGSAASIVVEHSASNQTPAAVLMRQGAEAYV
jgi:hypothetical protein